MARKHKHYKQNKSKSTATAGKIEKAKLSKAQEYALRSCAKSSMISELDIGKGKACDISEKELQELIDKKLVSTDVAYGGEKLGNVRYYKLEGDGKKWLKANTEIRSFQGFRLNQFRHDLMLSRVYNNFAFQKDGEEIQRSWKTEHQGLDSYKSMYGESPANMVDASVEIDGMTYGIEIIGDSSTYSDAYVAEKMEVGKALGFVDTIPFERY